MSIKANVSSLKKEIKALQKKLNLPYDVKVCAVTKYADIDKMKLLLDAGINHFGENRAQSFEQKYEALKDYNIIWHFIGSLQTNKVKKVINKISYLHSLDRDSLAKEINKQRKEILNCFVQVNCSNEISKHGIKPDEVIEFIKTLRQYEKIRIIGLMTMAENTTCEKTIRNNFRCLKNIQTEVIKLNLSYAPCTELSMGMSNDYIYAIEEGATIVRIGSRLFT